MGIRQNLKNYSLAKKEHARAFLVMNNARDKISDVIHVEYGVTQKYQTREYKIPCEVCICLVGELEFWSIGDHDGFSRNYTEITCENFIDGTDCANKNCPMHANNIAYQYMLKRYDTAVARLKNCKSKRFSFEKNRK